jgi:hypothetical protein
MPGQSPKRVFALDVPGIQPFSVAHKRAGKKPT